MNAPKVRDNGHPIPDEPQGTEEELSAADPGDDLDAAERAQLHVALELSCEQLKAGKIVSAADLIAELRRRG
jgi:hypothetical protein